MGFMEIFRGEGRRTWQCRFTDHRGLRRQFSTRTKDRGTALSISHKIERIKDVRVRGDQLPQELCIWITHAHKDIRTSIIAWGMVDAGVAGAGELLYNGTKPNPIPPDWKSPPPALVDQWETSLIEGEITQAHGRQSAQRVRSLLQMPVADMLPIRYPAEISIESIMPRVRELRRVGAPHGHKKRKRKSASPRTCQYYLDRAREFCGWLVSKGILNHNPLAEAVAYTEPVMRANRQRNRRILTIQEQLLLITGTPKLGEHHGMNATERGRIYHLALRSGLRAREIRTLCACNFNFFTKQITLLAGFSKARRQDLVPLSPDLVEPMKEQMTGKHPQAPAFTVLNEKKYCEMLREDMTALGIAFIDPLGQYADFHALRHTFGSELAKVTMPFDHKKLMRHSDIRTTEKFYVHTEQAATAAAISKLPHLTLPPAKSDVG